MKPRKKSSLTRKQADQLAPPAIPLPGQHPVVITGQQALDKMTDRQMLERIYRMLVPVQRFFGKD